MASAAVAHQRKLGVEDPERRVLHDATGPKVASDLRVVPLTTSFSHHAPRAHGSSSSINGKDVFQSLDANGATARRGSRASKQSITSWEVISGVPTTYDAAGSLNNVTMCTQSIIDGPTIRADQLAMTAFSSTPQDHQSLAQPDAALSTISLDNHWLSSQERGTTQTLMCPYHEPILQGNFSSATQGLDPMARYFGAPASEQYALFYRFDTGQISTAKRCRCLKFLQLDILAEEEIMH